MGAGSAPSSTLRSSQSGGWRLSLSPARWPAWAWVGSALLLVAVALGCRAREASTGLLVWGWLPCLPAAALLWLSFRASKAGDRRVSAHLLVAIAAFALLAGFGARRCTYAADGDEAWYFAMSDSLVRDGDVWLTEPELHDRSGWYYGRVLADDQIVGIGGHRCTTHWPALAAFIALGAWLHSTLISRLEIALLICVALGVSSRAFAKLLQSDEEATVAVGALLVATPLATYALDVFPDGIAAALTLLCFSSMVLWSSPRGVAAAAVFAGALVFLKPSFALLALAAAGLGGVHLLRTRSARLSSAVTFGAVFGALCAAFIGVQWSVYGQVELYALDPELSAIPVRVLSSLFAPGRGLLVHYPAAVGLLVAASLVVVRQFRARRDAPAAYFERLLLVSAVALSLTVVVLSAAFRATSSMGGWAPPGRYWVPWLAFAACLVVLEHERLRPWIRRLYANVTARRVTAALLVVSVSTNLLFAALPRLSFTEQQHWMQKLAGFRTFHDLTPAHLLKALTREHSE